MVRVSPSDWGVGVGQLPPLPPPCTPWPDCIQTYVPPVSVGLQVGEQPQPPREERTAADVLWAVLLGATPVIIAGVVVHYLTREKPPRSEAAEAGEAAEGPRSYVFLTSCVGWHEGQDINDMKARAVEISRRQFLGFVDPSAMREVEAGLGYERDSRRGLTMARDWHVSYHRSTFVGVPCVYFAWSGIEHIFVDPDAWNRRSRGL